MISFAKIIVSKKALAYYISDWRNETQHKKLVRSDNS